MSAEENKAIVRRYIEQIWNKGRLDLFEEFIAKDVVPHSPTGRSDAETMKGAVTAIRDAFPDLSGTFDNDIAVDDKVVARWTVSGTHQGEFLGVPATGKEVTWSGITIFRLTGAKIVEFWAQSDDLGLMQQLGVVAMPGG